MQKAALLTVFAALALSPSARAQGEPAAPEPPASPQAAPAPSPSPSPSPSPAAPGAKQAGADQALPTPESSFVLHVAPGHGEEELALRLTAVVDGAWTEAALLARYRPAGSGGAFAEVPFERSSAGGYYALIPADVMRPPGIEYYIVGQRTGGDEALHFASAAAPHPVIVAPSRAARWAERELDRLGGHRSSVSVDLIGHNFGNRFGNRDQYIRGELDFTHRLLGRLYAISLGYGFIEGRTPDGITDEASSESQGARYGYGGVRVRLHRAIWVDARAALGVGKGGFIVGGGGELTLGRPWRSNLSAGGEVLQELGPSAWIRLQWDTVPPFLMRATIMKTDLPAATLPDGAFLIYEVIYPVSPRLTLRGSLSFGSRDGPGNFGGGLGTSLAF